MYRQRSKKDTFFQDSSSSLTKDNDYLQFRLIYERLKEKYKLGPTEIINQLEKKEILIPASIFCRELSGLEIIVKYLKENLGFSNNKIASLLNRSEKTIWQAYNNSKKKFAKKLEVEFSEYYIPVSIFTDRRFSVLELIVAHLKEIYNLKFSEIAVILKRDDRTVWTSYNRYQMKRRKVVR